MGRNRQIDYFEDALVTASGTRDNYLSSWCSCSGVGDEIDFMRPKEKNKKTTVLCYDTALNEVAFP